MNRRNWTIGVAVAIAALSVLTLVSPASAAPIHNYNLEMKRGRITVGSTNFDTPGGGTGLCPGTTGISGTTEQNDPAPVGVDNMTGTINITSGDFSNFALGAGDFQLSATGTTGNGADRGDFNYATTTFANLRFATINFSIKRIDVDGPDNVQGTGDDCLVGTTLCSGTATMTLSGGTVAPATPPLAVGDQVYANSTAGSITGMVIACPFPASLVIRAGAALTLAKNPAFPADLGAAFTQI